MSRKRKRAAVLNPLHPLIIFLRPCVRARVYHACVRAFVHTFVPCSCARVRACVHAGVLSCKLLYVYGAFTCTYVCFIAHIGHDRLVTTYWSYHISHNILGITYWSYCACFGTHACMLACIMLACICLHASCIMLVKAWCRGTTSRQHLCLSQ